MLAVYGGGGACPLGACIEPVWGDRFHKDSGVV